MKTFKELQENLKGVCWKGYEAIGTKKKNGKEVPNCVPVKESDAAWTASQEKKKEDKLTSKDKDTLGKLHDLMAKQKKPVNEEQLDELSNDKLDSYLGKAHQSNQDTKYDLAHSQGSKGTDAERAAMKAKIQKRTKGMTTAIGKMMQKQDAAKKDVKESTAHKIIATKLANMDRMNNVQIPTPAERTAQAEKEKQLKTVKEKCSCQKEELDEATSPMQKLRDAHDRHMEKALAANRAGDDEATKVHQQYMQKITAKMNKLKQNEEIDLQEMEELCEISKATLGSYIKKSSHDAALSARHGGKDPKELQHTIKRLKGIAKATNKLTTEEAELSEALEYVVYHSKTGAVHSVHKDKPAAEKTKSNLTNHKIGSRKAGSDHSFVSEEAEQIDELDKATLGSYAKKSHDQLMKHTSTVNFKSGRGDKDAFSYEHDKDNMRKTANRTKGLNQAITKLSKEEKINVADEKKNELPFEPDAPHKPVATGGKHGVGYSTARHLARMALKKVADKKLNKEEAEIEEGFKEMDAYLKQREKEKGTGNFDKKKISTGTVYTRKWEKDSKKDKEDVKESLSFKEFMSSLTEALNKSDIPAYQRKDDKLTLKDLEKERTKNRSHPDAIKTLNGTQVKEAAIDDLKDKLALKKANQSAYDKSYKPAEKSAVTKVKGHSYGAGEEEGSDDDDTKKVSKPAAPDVKRGRGRPAGSKSGAR